MVSEMKQVLKTRRSCFFFKDLHCLRERQVRAKIEMLLRDLLRFEVCDVCEAYIVREWPVLFEDAWKRTINMFVLLGKSSSAHLSIILNLLERNCHALDSLRPVLPATSRTLAC